MSALSDPSIALYRSLLRTDPGLASVHADLGQALLDAGEVEGAVSACDDALSRDASLTEAWLTRAAARKLQCRHWDELRDLEHAAALAPDRPMILVSIATSYAELERLDDAERVLRRACALNPRCKEAQANLGSILVRQGRLAEAEKPCRAALALHPGLITAHQNLSSVLAAADPAAAAAHRDAAYRQQQVFVDAALRPRHSVLVLSAADAANVPLHHLMPRAEITGIRWYFEYATPGQQHALPRHDLVFNAVGDPDLAPAIRPDIARWLHQQGACLLNDPDRVAVMRRSDLPTLLAGIPGVIVPPVLRHDPAQGGVADAVASAAMAYPVLLRPLGSHGGQDLSKIGGPAELAACAAGPAYVTEFADFVSADGWYRKYRMIFVDGQAYPYHLAISPTWLVHHWTAGMERDPARRDEERRFLADPAAAIGTRAMAALEQIGARLGLDYAGVDFGIAQDGRVLVFEANATMLVHPELDGCFSYRNPAVRAIQQAFLAMLDARKAAQHQVNPARPLPGQDAARASG